MKGKLCLPLLLQDLTDCEAQIDAMQDSYHFFELWVDGMEEIDLDILRSLARAYPDRLIILTRRENLAPPRKSPEEQYSLLLQLAALPVVFDFDVKTQGQLLDSLKEVLPKERLLLSMHDYECTPSSEELQECAAKMVAFEPGIYKFACACTSAEDALRLLQFQQTLLKSSKRVIVLGMGPFGTITRVYGTLWGNEMIFAPLDRSGASAPGQLTLNELEQIFAVLENAHGGE